MGLSILGPVAPIMVETDVSIDVNTFVISVSWQVRMNNSYYSTAQLEGNESTRVTHKNHVTHAHVS